MKTALACLLLVGVALAYPNERVYGAHGSLDLDAVHGSIPASALGPDRIVGSTANARLSHYVDPQFAPGNAGSVFDLPKEEGPVYAGARPSSPGYDSRFLGWTGNGFAAPAVAAHGFVAPAVTAPRLAPPSHAGPAAGGPGSPGYQNRLLASAIARHNTPWGAIGHGHTLRYGPHYYQ